MGGMGSTAGLAVIILNWNAADDTIRCVREIEAWEHLRPTIWVVDNGSAEESIAAIAQSCPNVRLIRNGANLGFAGGTNRGIVAALAVDEVPILLLNNDASVAEPDIARLLDTLHRDKRIGFVGPLLFDMHDTEHLLSAGGRNPVLHHHSHILTLSPGPPVRTVAYVPGTVVVVRPEVFRQVGLLDENYFFSMEVADLCRRAAQIGYRSVVDTRARAFHSLERSSDLRGTLHVYYIIRNRFLFIRKFYPRSMWLLSAVWSLYSLALWLKVRAAGRPTTARAIWLGLWDGLHGRFGGQNERVFSYVGGK
ncbi:MAG TPA: glycosyltransferase family 2 protein [Thermoflexia bacterium]|jgi:GT2 family glycosyltransferase|nr:glycosyltransferase family 2 protein [Thermoflexia bacterium]